MKNNSFCLLFFLFLFSFCISANAQDITQADIDDYEKSSLGEWGCLIGCSDEQKAWRKKVAEAAKKQKSQIVLNASDASLNAAISDPIQKLKDAASKYTKGLQSTATSLFWLLVAITFSYQFGFMVLKRSDVGEFFAEFVKFTILKQNLELRKMIAQQNQMIALEKQAEFDKEAKSQAIFKSREVAPLQALKTRSISVNGSSSSGYKDCGNDLSLGCGL